MKINKIKLPIGCFGISLMALSIPLLFFIPIFALVIHIFGAICVVIMNVL